MGRMVNDTLHHPRRVIQARSRLPIESPYATSSY